MKTQIKSLNILLSSVSITIANIKAYHWMIKGNNFFVLHEKFGEFYDFMADHQDKIAERILALEDEPYLGYSNYLKYSIIKETIIKGTERNILEEILTTLDLLILQAQKVKEASIKIDDDETDNYMQEIIYEMQKLHWQYGAQLGYN
jgi:starvation-inducible DNA-binding protein